MDGNPIELSGEGKERAEPLVIVTSGLRFSEYVELVGAVDILYHSLSGDRLEIRSSEKLDGNLGDGTARPTPFSVDVPRDEVHEAIESLLKDPETRTRVRTDLERRFPESTWAKVYPFRWAVQALLDASQNDR